MPAAKRKPTHFHLPGVIASHTFFIIGICLMLSGLMLFSLIFYPIAKEEISYTIAPPSRKQQIVPRDATFGIVIPKINANAKIIPNVDPYHAKEYQLALTKGVAHAKGTVFPGRVGNSFLFAHSSVNFYEASRYNSIFYLIDKLDMGDEIDVFVNKEKFVYTVTAKKFVDPAAIDYLTSKTDKKMLTIMTCWPPGTTFQRLLVMAEAR